MQKETLEEIEEQHKSLAYLVALFILQGVARMEKKCKTENQMTKVVCISWLWQKFCRSLARFAFHLVYLFLYIPPPLPFALLSPFRCLFLSVAWFLALAFHFFALLRYFFFGFLYTACHLHTPSASAVATPPVRPFLPLAVEL